MGSPHLNISTFHITGTNGKGSVTHKMASALTSAGNYLHSIHIGYITGEYTSPMIFTYRDNILVDGIKISQVDYVIHHQLCAAAALKYKKSHKKKRNIGSYGVN